MLWVLYTTGKENLIDANPIYPVIAYDEKSEEVFVITAYEPDNEHFEFDWKTRRIK